MNLCRIFFIAGCVVTASILLLQYYPVPKSLLGIWLVMIAAFIAAGFWWGKDPAAKEVEE